MDTQVFNKAKTLILCYYSVPKVEGGGWGKGW